ncbi:MAG TPA: M23 family metallopeptidase [Polyangiaceae bacterium]|nr:M23 family metallopeptidase [Polyangiaceae bacterium]
MSAPDGQRAKTRARVLCGRRMRGKGYGLALTLFGLFAACGNDADDAPGPGSGATSGAGTGATSASGAGGSSAGRGGAAGSSGATSTSGGAAGVAGASAARGGTAGQPVTAGTSGSAPRAGAGGRGGSAGASGAGTSGSGGSGAMNQAGAAPDDAGAAGASGASGAPSEPVGLSWPIDCIPNETCASLGYPDTDDDGKAHDCGDPQYVGHQGTDIGITFDAEAAGTAVRAAADGVVLFAFDGKYDQCPDANEPDCQDPPSLEPGGMTGNTVCTPVGPYCGTGQPGCFWCFAGGNVIVIRHEGVPGVFATRYDHLKKDSVRVQPGDSVTRGQKLAEAASAGNSTGPHLHFEVWGTGFYELADPWAGPCGPNTGPSLWAYDPPWSG